MQRLTSSHTTPSSSERRAAVPSPAIARRRRHGSLSQTSCPRSVCDRRPKVTVRTNSPPENGNARRHDLPALCVSISHNMCNPTSP